MIEIDNIDQDWKIRLADEFHQPYFTSLLGILKEQYNSGGAIYPPKHLLFKAFDLTAFDEVKVVILGQDPYHNDGQAMGLSFSVPRKCKIPRSLSNIYKELKNEYPDYIIPTHGDLSFWAEQGVLLLNSALTVKAHQPSSHGKIGWQYFTDRVISMLSDQRQNIVFMLWGNFAKQKQTLIDAQRHLILTAAHPSPFSVTNFFHCGHFRLANQYLAKHNSNMIDWQIPN